jgi:hypothetical protein
MQLLIVLYEFGKKLREFNFTIHLSLICSSQSPVLVSSVNQCTNQLSVDVFLFSLYRIIVRSRILLPQPGYWSRHLSPACSSKHGNNCINWRWLKLCLKKLKQWFSVLRQPLSMSVNIAGAVGSVLIAVTLVVMLRKSRTGFSGYYS